MIKYYKYLKANFGFARFFNIQIFAAVISVGLGKFIATYFTPDIFGAYSIITSIFSLFTAILVTPLIQSYRFIYLTYEYTKLNTFYFSLFSWLLILLSIIIFVVSFYLNLPGLVILIGISTLFFQTYQSILAAGVNLKGLNVQYANLQLILPLITFIVLIFSVFSIKDQSIFALLTANLLAQLTILILLLILNKDHKQIILLSIRNTFTNEKMKNVLIFVRPLIFLPLFTWMVNSGDKLLIKYIISDHAVGIYSASYSIGSKIFLTIGGIIISYLNVSTYNTIKNGISIIEMKFIIYNRVKIYFILGLIVVFFASLFSNLIGHVLLSPLYAEGFYLIGLLALSSLFTTCFFFWEQVIYAIGATTLITKHYIFGAVLNLGLNVLLIPIYGITGAAIAMTISSFFQLLFLTYIFNNYSKKQQL